ncbi:MAG: isoprenyl transferase [Nitrospirae bacterium]|nr:isoprenyl transferase [Nitrospirota bacterium]
MFDDIIKDRDVEQMDEEELVSLIDKERLPKHIAFIMDGNGRWARERYFPRIAGHREGIESVRDIIRLGIELGIKVLTFYAFSVENWRRPEEEVNALMLLLESYLKKELHSMKKNGIRFHTIGRIQELPQSARRWIEKAINETRNNKTLTLNMALSYGGRAEITDAAKAMAKDLMDKKTALEEVTEEFFARYLNTAGLPDPDLMIRTSGESRISNFLLWQLAYTELHFTKTLWPDFRRREMLLAIIDYQKRERRFGLTSEQVNLSAPVCQTGRRQAGGDNGG